MSDKGKKTPEPRRALGRGLDALLPVATEGAVARVESEFQRVGVERLKPQPGQPRKRFEPQALAELAESLRQQGMIQPIVVRRTDDGYEIVAGERRWRAAQRAGMHEVPIIIKELAPAAAFELALVENIQRTDLDPLETAEAYQRLLAEHGYTQESLAERVGKSRAAVTNTLRLLQLPDAVRARVAGGELSEGHARALLTARDGASIEQLADQAVTKSWSVRETEAAARKAATPAGDAARAEKSPPPAAPKNANVREVEAKLRAALGMAVVIREDPSTHSGTVEFAFDSLQQLDVLLDRVLGR